MLLLSGFGLLALTLAAVGIAGVVGYSVVRRTPEIGLRMALGAQRGDVLRMILGQSLLWTMIGIGVGVAAAFGLLRFLDTLLYGIEPADPLVLGAASTLLVTVAIAASYLPARRAMRIDAVRALRERQPCISLREAPPADRCAWRGTPARGRRRRQRSSGWR